MSQVSKINVGLIYIIGGVSIFFLVSTFIYSFQNMSKSTENLSIVIKPLKWNL